MYNYIINYKHVTVDMPHPIIYRELSKRDMYLDSMQETIASSLLEHNYDPESVVQVIEVPNQPIDAVNVLNYYIKNYGPWDVQPNEKFIGDVINNGYAGCSGMHKWKTIDYIRTLETAVRLYYMGNGMIIHHSQKSYDRTDIKIPLTELLPYWRNLFVSIPPVESPYEDSPFVGCYLTRIVDGGSFRKTCKVVLVCGSAKNCRVSDCDTYELANMLTKVVCFTYNRDHFSKLSYDVGLERNYKGVIEAMRHVGLAISNHVCEENTKQVRERHRSGKKNTITNVMSY